MHYVGELVLALSLVLLVWSANTESDLAGYRLYWRPFGGHWEQVWQGTSTSARVSVDEGELAVGAFDLAGNESTPSNIVRYLRCDLDGDGDCDGIDLSLFGRSFGR